MTDPVEPAALTAAIADLEAIDKRGLFLSEIENEVAFTESVLLCLHELKRLRANEGRQPRFLEPDATDIRLIRDAVLPRCPCCDATPTTFSRHFAHSDIFQSYVHCPRCDVQVFKNARDHDEARELAIAAWSRRPKVPEATAPDAAWIDWSGGQCPVAADALVWVQYLGESRSQATAYRPQRAHFFKWQTTRHARKTRRIIAYCLAGDAA